MKARKILFPTDFSTTADEALKFATMIAKDTGAKLLIVHVAEIPSVYGAGEMYYGIVDPDISALNQLLKAVTPSDPAVAHEHRMLTGDPAGAITELAKAEDCDLIVMSTHGRTGLGRALMGSVAEVIVRRASCPVLTLKAKQPAASAATGKWRP